MSLRKYDFLKIHDIPEYLNYNYSFNLLTVYLIITAIIDFSSVILTLKMVKILCFNTIRVKHHGLDVSLFISFLIMQISFILYVIGDFLIIRIPSTGFFNQWCAGLDEGQNFLYLPVTLSFFAGHQSQLFTVLFCFMRLVILYFPRDYRLYTPIVLKFLAPTFFVIGCWSLHPLLTSYGFCIQLGYPFPEGAIAVISTFLYGSGIWGTAHWLFSIIVVFLLVIISVMLLIKLKTHLKMVSESRSKQRRRAEKTLTISTILVILPILISLIFSTAIGYFTFLSAYIMMFRPVIIDCRLNISTWYFYCTHPIFEKKYRTSPIASAISSGHK